MKKNIVTFLIVLLVVGFFGGTVWAQHVHSTDDIVTRHECPVNTLAPVQNPNPPWELPPPIVLIGIGIVAVVVFLLLNRYVLR